jgi:hypothetical protein
MDEGLTRTSRFNRRRPAGSVNFPVRRLAQGVMDMASTKFIVPTQSARSPSTGPCGAVSLR